MINSFILPIAVLLLEVSSGQNWPFEKQNSSPVEFFQEEITLAVDDSQATINGVYHFRNNTDSGGEFPTAFPFYVDSLSLFPNKISAYTLDSGKIDSIEYRILSKANGILLKIPLKPNSISIWHLDYTQKIKSSHARYILTSTASWHKPLEKATYRFIVPAKFENVSIWPAADTVIDSSNFKVYTCLRKDFMPQKDMEIFWQQK